MSVHTYVSVGAVASWRMGSVLELELQELVSPGPLQEPHVLSMLSHPPDPLAMYLHEDF